MNISICPSKTNTIAVIGNKYSWKWNETQLMPTGPIERGGSGGRKYKMFQTYLRFFGTNADVDAKQIQLRRQIQLSKQIQLKVGGGSADATLGVVYKCKPGEPRSD